MDTATKPRVLDRRGKTITTFVVFDAATELASMVEGHVLDVVTDDFAPFEADIAAWCKAAGHELVSSERVERGRSFRIKKGLPAPKATALAMVISMDGLEELLSPLGFALAAALEGIEVNLYFQGPAVRVLTNGFRPKLHGWGRPFSRFAAAGMAKSGHIAAQDKLRQLRSLGATFYVCGGSLGHFKVDPGDFVFPDLPVVEYLTFMAVMERADIQLYL
jgi:TusA-related sulfurtransferase/predicted peroxiredoxin